MLAVMMSVTRSIVPCSAFSQRFQVSVPVTKFKYKSQFLGNQRLESLSLALKLLYARNTKNMDMAVYSGVEPGPAPPSDSSDHGWKGWILGMLISILALPFGRNKWGPLLLMKDKIVAVVETADHVADVVEEVAEEVGKVADEVADHLPEGGTLQQVATFVENVAKETAKDAHLVDEVIEKVEEVEKEVESFAEQITEQANGIPKEAKD